MSKQPEPGAAGRFIGIIGGTGLYDPGILGEGERVVVDTPYGAPSDALVVTERKTKSGPVRVAFLPRHGVGHRITPTEVNYRANIWAMKKLGVQRIFSVSAVGSMREEIHPGDVVVVDQFFDRTVSRPRTFFGEGIVAHVSVADPVCGELARVLHESAVATSARVHKGGTYVCIEGPQFSTRAESKVFRSWGVSVIGMTNLPEARLAREAELCYATLALATDYDCWHEGEEDVTAEGVMVVLRKNVETARRVLWEAIERLPLAAGCGCGRALEFALITAPERIPPARRAELDLLVGKYLPHDAPKAP